MRSVDPGPLKPFQERQEVKNASHDNTVASSALSAAVTSALKAQVPWWVGQQALVPSGGCPPAGPGVVVLSPSDSKEEKRKASLS